MLYAERVWFVRARRFIFIRQKPGFAFCASWRLYGYKQLNIMGLIAPTPLPMPILQRRCAKDL